MSAERSGTSCRSMRVPGSNQGFLGGVVQALAGNSISRQLRHRNTHRRKMQALSRKAWRQRAKGVASSWMVSCLLRIWLPVVGSTVQWWTQQQLPLQYSQWSRNLPHQSPGIHRKKQQWQKVTVGAPQGIEWDQVKHNMAHRGGTGWVEQHHMKEEETTLFQSTTFRTPIEDAETINGSPGGKAGGLADV